MARVMVSSSAVASFMAANRSGIILRVDPEFVEDHRRPFILDFILSPLPGLGRVNVMLPRADALGYDILPFQG